MAIVAPAFERYDAWILAAVIWGSDGGAPVPLWRVIAVADALNKAIVSRGELEVGMERLVCAGYVRAVPDGFEPTPMALALKAPGPPVEIVAEAIGAREWSARDEMPRTTSAAYVTAEALRKGPEEVSKRVLEEVPIGEAQMTDRR
jgi:hypothetical protein